MKYYLIAGEASGDLHASNLMAALKQEDPEAEFRFLGGDLMKAQGGTCVKHYREMAYMGFIPVLLNSRTILKNMKACKEDIRHFNPDVVILIDYPGFNLSIAKYVKQHTNIPVYYYISPKIWAWKEYRIHDIKKYVDHLFSILPFEVDFFAKHDYPVHYVGNPCVDAVSVHKEKHPENPLAFRQENQLTDQPIIALLAGSRKQEIKDNLPMMIKAAEEFPDYQLVLAGAPGIDKGYYKKYIGDARITLLFGQTYQLLQYADAALVTSGTATLETALFRVPQVVCYYTPMGRLMTWLKKKILKVKYISLVNLIVNDELVQELVADRMTIENIVNELTRIVTEKEYNHSLLEGYDKLISCLGAAGASEQAAHKMVELLKTTKKQEKRVL